MAKPTISMGLELESYSISLPDNRINRELRLPKRAAIEQGEKFTRDWSIGSEYNSKVFTNIREAFFLLKSGLRKYFSTRHPEDPEGKFVIFPIGGWTDRFAGSHIHLALGKRPFPYKTARELAVRIHDHIPFLIVLTGNSPIWREKITEKNSNRLLLGSEKYCRATKRENLYKHHYRELTYNAGGQKKPPTLELRVCDSSIPEYLIAAACVCRAIALRWQKRKQVINISTHDNYLKARSAAVLEGVEAKLVWTNHQVKVSNYVDLFFRKYAEELREMDIPDEIIRIFKYLKKGINQAEVIRQAAQKCSKRHHPTWQRQFANKYSHGIQELLNGNSFEKFAKHLGVRLPSIDRVWLGREEARW